MSEKIWESQFASIKCRNGQTPKKKWGGRRGKWN